MPTGLEMVPLQEKLSGFVPICANMLRNDPGSGNQGCSTASQGSHPSCVETRPPLPISPFLLDQNLSLKQIAPTDNIQQSQTMPQGIISG